MRKASEGGRKEDLGGRESPLERWGSLPPNLPHSPRTFPKRTRLCSAKICFALYDAGALGESFCFWGGGNLLQRATVALGWWVGRARYNALHKSRDSACLRPFGVRLRGNCRVSRSPLHRCAAPLRMTQWVGRFVRYNLFVAMLL